MRKKRCKEEDETDAKIAVKEWRRVLIFLLKNNLSPELKLRPHPLLTLASIPDNQWPLIALNSPSPIQRLNANPLPHIKVLPTPQPRPPHIYTFSSIQMVTPRHLWRLPILLFPQVVFASARINRISINFLLSFVFFEFPQEPVPGMPLSFVFYRVWNLFPDTENYFFRFLFILFNSSDIIFPFKSLF